MSRLRAKRNKADSKEIEEKVAVIELQPFLVAQILALLTVANGAPVITKKIFGSFLANPLDNGLVLADGRPLFGSSKTLRGVVLAILATPACAPLVGLDWTIGLVVAVMAMIGDLVSSFTKRRLKLDSGSMALGLDQVPESLLPALACGFVLPLTFADILCVTALFFVGELAVSRVLYKLEIRDRPY